MDKQRDFLFDISREVKQFYETPIVYLTKKDFSDALFNAMCSLRAALLTEDSDKIIDTIVDLHLQWLHAVRDIENFKRNASNIAREEIYQAICYTIDALASRLNYYQQYMEKNRLPLSNSDQAYLTTELEIVEEMHSEVHHTLLEKMICYKSFVGDKEFMCKINETTDELLHWLDKIYDSLSTQISKYVNIHVPNLTSDMTKTLKQIVDELHTSQTPSAQRMLEDLKQKGREISSMIRMTAGHSLEISKVVEKINVLDDRIRRLESEPTSAAVMALTHKKEFLEKRLTSLEKLKTTLRGLHEMTDIELEDVAEEELCVCEDFFTFRIFNHSLPTEEREKLVTELCYLWDLAVFGEQSRKSIISILSAADTKEEFTDELGTYYIDENSRKIYKIPDDDFLYQLNEINELVPLSDDKNHIYFFDGCGRYFIDPITRQRIYKAHTTSSEYMMDSAGVLLKVKEEKDGVIYNYDHYGRYYVNEDGKNIYRDADTASEYENDGLGNLVRIRTQADILALCAGDANVSEDFNYLKHSIGNALRVSIADCILHQPADPVKYLSNRLKKYRENIEIKEKRASERESLNVEREIIQAEERAAAERAAMEAALLAQGGSEASYDSNIAKYIHPDDIISVASRK